MKTFIADSFHLVEDAPVQPPHDESSVRETLRKLIACYFNKDQMDRSGIFTLACALRRAFAGVPLSAFLDVVEERHKSGTLNIKNGCNNGLFDDFLAGHFDGKPGEVASSNDLLRMAKMLSWEDLLEHTDPSSAIEYIEDHGTAVLCLHLQKALYGSMNEYQSGEIARAIEACKVRR